jgi:2-polyprenyl-6-hydroxyphenyl methylase/3-demethylubiquinone-9 3-methyltransferase
VEIELRHPAFDPSWPAEWIGAYRFDSFEMWGDRSKLGYTYAYRERYARVLQAVRKAMPPPARLLDFAAAQGNFSIGFAAAGYDVVWNDIRSDLVEYVKLKDDTGRISYRPGNLFEFASLEPFDIVFAGEAIEHVAHPDEFLRKLASVVRPGGAIVITTPNGLYFRNNLPRFSDCPDPSVFESVQFKPDSDGHIFLLYPDEIRDLAEKAGLEVERLDLFANPLTAGHVKLGHLLPWLPEVLVRRLEGFSSHAGILDRLKTGMLAVLRRARR